MVRLRVRGRFCRCFRHIKTRECIILLMIGFISALLSFSFTLYINSEYVMELIDIIFGREPAKLDASQINSAENYIPRFFSGKLKSLNLDFHLYYRDFNYKEPETLTYETKKYFNNISISFRFPKDETSMSALLLIFHSCHDSAYDWFHTPERQRIIGAAIDLGYACLVFQAIDKCWSNEPDLYANEDIRMVFKGLEGFYKDYPKLESLPRFAFGSSSGGIFSSIFAINHDYEIQGQILFISIILPEILYTYVRPKNYPTTVWIHMLRDFEFATEDRINVSKKIFHQHQIPYNAFPIEPVQVNYMTFHNRIPSVTVETSRFLLFRLQQNHWLNNHNFLMYNPRRKFGWNDFLFPSSLPNPKSVEMLKNLNQNRPLISQFMNTIYGEHAISYERSFEALKWLKQTYPTSRNRTDSIK